MWDGSKVVFEQFKGKKIWLAFFRYASCPLCNLRVRKMIRLFDEFAEPGLQIIAIFQSPPALMAEYVGKQNPPFPLISDLGHKVYKAFHQNHISFDRIFNFASCGINSAQLNEKGFL